MPRVTKHPDLRRDELLDVALALCAEVGYEAMSVEQVTQRAGVAKGTFYHYFTSKTELLEQLVARFVEELFVSLETQVRTLPGSGRDKLLVLMASAQQWKTARLDATMAFLPALFRPENLLLRTKLYRQWGDRLAVLLTDAIREGSGDGSWDAPDAEYTALTLAGMMIEYSDRLLDRALAARDADGFADVMLRGTAALWTAIERILGAPGGSLALPVPRDIVRGLYEPLLAQLAGVRPASNPTKWSAS